MWVKTKNTGVLNFLKKFPNSLFNAYLNKYLNMFVKIVHSLCVLSCSVVCNSLWPCGLQSTRLLCPWDSLSKNTRVGNHSLPWGIFPTQESNSVSCIAGGFFMVWATREVFFLFFRFYVMFSSPDRLVFLYI